MWILRACLLPLEPATCLPVDFYSPTGPLRLLPNHWIGALWDDKTLLGLRLLLLGCSVCCFFSKGMRTCGIIVCVVATFEQALIRSFGVMKHAEISLLLTTYVMIAYALVGYQRQSKKNGDRDSADSSNPYAGCLLTASLVLTTTYSMVGLTRICEGGLEIFSSDVLVRTVLSVSNEPWFISFGIGENITNWPWLMTLGKAGFPLITFFEIIAPWSLVSRNIRVGVIIALGSMHLMVFILTHLLFLENFLLLTFLFDFGSEKDNSILEKEPTSQHKIGSLKST